MHRTKVVKVGLAQCLFGIAQSKMCGQRPAEAHETAVTILEIDQVWYVFQKCVQPFLFDSTLDADLLGRSTNDERCYTSCQDNGEQNQRYGEAPNRQIATLVRIDCPSDFIPLEVFEGFPSVVIDNQTRQSVPHQVHLGIRVTALSHDEMHSS